MMFANGGGRRFICGFLLTGIECIFGASITCLPASTVVLVLIASARPVLLRAVGAGPDHHQRGEPLVLQAHVEVHTVGPDVDVVAVRERPPSSRHQDLSARSNSRYALLVILSPFTTATSVRYSIDLKDGSSRARVDGGASSSSADRTSHFAVARQQP